MAKATPQEFDNLTDIMILYLARGMWEMDEDHGMRDQMYETIEDNCGDIEVDRKKIAEAVHRRLFSINTVGIDYK